MRPAQFSMTVAPGDYLVRVIGEPGSGFGTCFQNVTVPPGGTATVDCCLGVGSPPHAKYSIAIVRRPTRVDSNTDSQPQPDASYTDTDADPTPTPPPPAQAINLSTRMRVDGRRQGWHRRLHHYGKRAEAGAGAGDRTFVEPGSGIANRARRSDAGTARSGRVLTVTNNNWRDTQQDEIQATGIPPTNDLESAIEATLAPGAYTAIVRGQRP